MFRWNSAIVAGVALVAAHGATSGVSAPARVPDPARVQAEHNVLSFLQQERGRRWILHHHWGGRLLVRLVDPRTGLLRNNTKAICRRVHSRTNRSRFRCVVRPARHRRHEGLYVSYRSLRHGQFRIKWLIYRRGSARTASAAQA